MIPPALIHWMLISPLTHLIQLLSSKHPANCPSWERKKNVSRVRFRYEVRLKLEHRKTQRALRRTKDSTNVERSAKTNTIYVIGIVNPVTHTTMEELLARVDLRWQQTVGPNGMQQSEVPLVT